MPLVYRMNKAIFPQKLSEVITDAESVNFPHFLGLGMAGARSLIRHGALSYLGGAQGKEPRMDHCRQMKVMLASMAAVLFLLAGCATLRGTDPGSAAADRILGPHSGGLVVSVIVPSADRNGTAIAPEQQRAAVRRTEGEMARIFGGYTTHTGTRGGWRDDKGAVETEEHAAMVTSYGGDKDADQTLAAVRDLAAALARDLNQHCISVIVNDRMYLVLPAKQPQ